MCAKWYQCWLFMCRSYRCGTLSFQEKASETHERFCWESFGSFGHQNLLRALDGDIFIKNLALYIQVAKCYVNFPATTAKVKANCGKCWSLMCSKTCIIHAREPLLNCDFSFFFCSWNKSKTEQCALKQNLSSGLEVTFRLPFLTWSLIQILPTTILSIKCN